MLGHGENSLFETHATLHTAYPDVPLHVVVADIRDRVRIERIFQQLAPDIVFHAAAHKHVPLMEENFEDAISNNVVGTNILVDAAAQSGAKRFVAISTDKAVSPSCVMGASKRMASLIVQDAARHSGRSFVVVRFGNVLGSRGSVVPCFKAQIERGGPVTITYPEMKRFFRLYPDFQKGINTMYPYILRGKLSVRPAQVGGIDVNTLLSKLSWLLRIPNVDRILPLGRGATVRQGPRTG